MMKYDSIIEEVKKIYPNINEEEAIKLIDEALEQKPVKEVIVNYICYKKVREK